MAHVMRPLLFSLVAAILVQACTPVPLPPAPQPDLTSCNAVGLEGLIGAPASLLPTDGEWSALRIINPGQAVTMDYSATRLNVRVNEAGIIQSLSCG